MPPTEPTLTPTALKPAVKPEETPVTATGAPVAGQDTYVVEKGDYLSKIAARYGVTTRELMQVNGLKSDKIRENQRLLLPARASKQPLQAVQPVKKQVQAPEAAPSAGMDTYTVQNGDCLSKIAARCGTTVQALRNQNKLTGDRVYVGQKLVVPKGGSAQAPSTAPVPAAKTPANITTPAVKSRASVSAPAPVAAMQPPSNFVTHDVQFGETLDEVAGKYSVSTERLMSANGLKTREIKPGMILKIPQND
jgi:LysM repeat protein